MNFPLRILKEFELENVKNGCQQSKSKLDVLLSYSGSNNQETYSLDQKESVEQKLEICLTLFCLLLNFFLYRDFCQFSLENPKGI